MQGLTVVASSTPTSARFFQKLSLLVHPVSNRHASNNTYRRPRSRLNVKPDASFLPSKTERHDHIIHNPPPSMPNVYHTPTIILPKSDPRRNLPPRPSTTVANSLFPPASTANTSTPSALPPSLRSVTMKRYHITEDQVQEMRELYLSAPNEWNRYNLGKKFDCSPFFALQVIGDLRLPEEVTKRNVQKEVLDVVKSNWGVKRRVAREDRKVRKEKWFRDE